MLVRVQQFLCESWKNVKNKWNAWLFIQKTLYVCIIFYIRFFGIMNCWEWVNLPDIDTTSNIKNGWVENPLFPVMNTDEWGDVDKIQREFDADIEEVTELKNFVDGVMKWHNINLSSDEQFFVDLALEEIFVNIANYAYEWQKGKCKLSLDFSEENVVIFTFEDSWKEFNPKEQIGPDITLSVEDREIWGLGIGLVKKIMDIEYRREKGRNILVLKYEIWVKWEKL